MLHFDEQQGGVYYHVISDIPKVKGEHLLLDDRHPNRVYARVSRQMNAVRDVYADPKKYERQELPHDLLVALRELALEKVRKEKYPRYPSRMAALYVSRTFEEAERWGEFFARIGRPTYGIARIRSNGRVFIGDACKCFDGTASEAENLRLAEKYWENAADESEEPPVTEILVDGDIEILEIIKVIDANIP